MEIKTETELVNYLKDNGKKSFLLALKCSAKTDVKFNYPIYGCVTGEVVGYADIYITRGKRTYIGEIKFEDCKANSFWSSLKIIGYCYSQNLFFLKKGDNQVYPFIMIPHNHIKYDFLPILYKLKCGYITFNIKDEFVEFDINLNHESESFI